LSGEAEETKEELLIRICCCRVENRNQDKAMGSRTANHYTMTFVVKDRSHGVFSDTIPVIV
jgi:hypothetical protein